MPLTSLKILSNTPELNVLRFDTISFVDWLKIVLSILSSLALIIKMLISSQNPLDGCWFEFL